uniref:hypothetical protein n=1 Tax=Fulvivirga sp. TaxID=1931237 RepID=UPI004048F76A
MKTSLIIPVLLLFICSACSLSETDYISKYQFYHSNHFQVPDKDRSMKDPLIFMKSDIQEKHKTEAYEVLLLDEVNIDIFQDQSSNTIKGEMKIDFNQFQKQQLFSNTGPKIAKSQLNFDLSNLRIENDTLYFKISNPKMNLTGRFYSGFILKSNNKSLIGISNDLFFESDSGHNPWFNNKSEHYFIYKSSFDNSEQLKLYYSQQIDSLSSKLADSTALSYKEKQITENSIDYLTKNYVTTK